MRHFGGDDDDYCSMNFECTCGFTTPMQPHEWPLRCACGRFYKDAETPPVKITATPSSSNLSSSEVAELFPGEDATLLGNRIAALTEAIGIPHCGGCESRRRWLNKAHDWLRSIAARGS